MKTFDGYKKQALTDVYALLAGGGHKPLSEFSMAHTHPYLPLNGGTLTGPLEIKSSVNNNYNEGLRITRAGNSWAGITFGSSGLAGAPTNGWFAALNPSNQFIIAPNGSSSTTGLTLNIGGDIKWKNNTIWHAGNDGSGSGLDADTLDGNHASAFATAGHNHFDRLSGVNIDTGLSHTLNRHYEINSATGTLPFSSDWHQVYVMGGFDSGYTMQICTGLTVNTPLYFRHRINTTWNSWRTILDSANYNDYAPTKTGGGASGTWGISITGNATTSTKSTYSRSLLGRSTSGSDYDSSAGNLVFAEWNTKSDNRWYLKTSGYECRVAYASNSDTVDGYHARNVYNAPSFLVHNSNTSNTYVLLATITISGTSLACAEFTTLFQNRECLDNSSFILSGAIRRNSTTSVGATLSYITLHTGTLRNIYLRSDDGVTFRVYIQSAANSWTTYYRAIPIVDSGNITYSNTGTTSPISGSVLNIAATKGGNVNYANSAGSALTATIASKLGTSTVGATNVPIYLNGGTPTVVNLNSTANNLINNLSEGTSTPTDADYYVSQYVGGGTTTITYHRRPHSALYAYIKGKAEGTWGISITGNATSATNADKVDGYHASSLWRSDGATWNPGANVSLNASGNNQEWSFDIRRNGHTGCIWHVWDSDRSSMLRVNADNGKVYAPYNFVGNLEGNASSSSKWLTARTFTIGNTSKNVDGSGNVSWSLSEIGAASSSHTHPYLPLSGGTISGNLAVTGSVTFLSEGKLKIWNVTSTRNSNYGAEMVFVQTSIDSADPETKWPDKNRNDLFLQPKGGHVHIGPIETAQNYTCYVAGTLRATDTITAPTFSGNLSGNASTATALTTSAGSATLPIYFNGGKPVACTASLIFSNLSNSGNNISVTVAGLNRTLTVGYASAASKINSRGNLTAYEEGSTTKGESGVNFYTVYNNGYPVTYGNLLHINGSGAGQILAEWCGSSTRGHLYYRSKRDNSANGWSTWGKVAFITDNVASASKWATARKITLSGSVTGSVSLDGSGDVTLATTTNHTHNWANIEGKPSTFAPSTHTHNFITIPACSTLNINSDNFSVEYAGGNNSVTTKPSGVDAFGVLKLRTAAGWYGQIMMSTNTAPGMYYRNANGLTSSIGWIKLLDSSNSNVSGGGSAWGSSITVNINGTSKTLTIPSNPNTDYRVTQSETTTANYRPLVLGYTNVSTAGSGMTGSVTNQVYLSNKFYVQPSTGNLYATNFVGSLSGNASTATSASKWTTARTLTLTGSVTGSASIDGSGNVSLATTTNHTHAYLPLSGGIMTGVIKSTFSSSTWINGVTNAIVKGEYTGYGAILSMPVKDGRVSLSSFPGNNNNIYFGYATTLQINAGTNSFNKQMYWDAVNNNLHADVFTGSLAGNASTATTATKLGTANVGATNIPIYLKAGVPTAVTLIDTANNLINNLTTGTSTPVDADYYVAQYVGGGTTTTTFHRRPHSALYTYIKNKANGTWGISITGNAVTATTAGALSNTDKSDPGSACSDGQNVKWFSSIAASSNYAGTNAGFPVTNNANGILWLGTYSGPYGWQIGFSSNSRIYARYINNNTFSTTANGGSWNKIAWTSDIPTKSSWNYDDVYSKLGHTHDDRYYTESEINSKLGAYLPLSGGTMTGALNFKNGTWNLMGDDAYIGDCNVGGMIGVKGANAATPGFVFYNNSGTLLGKLYASGGTLIWSGGTIQATTFNGNATTASNADKLDGYHASSFALSGHTHTLSLATDTGSSSIDLAHGGKYKLTAGGNSIIFTLPTNDNVDPTNYYWANINISTTSSTKTSPTFSKVMINTTTSTYQLNVSGDSYITGWCRAASGLTCTGYGVYFTHNNSLTSAGEIDIQSTNEFCWGSSDGTLHFNYRKVSRGTTVTKYIWNAGSSTAYASHTMGDITATSINASGNIYATHFYENSDIRYKKVLKNLLINSNTIATLPLFDFEWIENNTIGTGTSAQAVQQILPNLVSGTDKLTLDYGVLGTIAGITACKELVTLKSELQQLKEKVKLLEDKLRKYENI